MHFVIRKPGLEKGILIIRTILTYRCCPPWHFIIRFYERKNSSGLLFDTDDKIRMQWKFIVAQKQF